MSYTTVEYENPSYLTTTCNPQSNVDNPNGEYLTFEERVTPPPDRNQNFQSEILQRKVTRLKILAVVFITLFVISIFALVACCVLWLTSTSPSTETTTIQTTDVCDPNPCYNSGTCSKLVEGFSCECQLAYPGIRCEPVLSDCLELYRAGYTMSGIYKIAIWTNKTILDVYCDMESFGGGWMVLMRRKYGNVDFNRGWNAYKEGFGDWNGDFWLGNEKFHMLTADQAEIQEMLIELKRFNSTSLQHARYFNFSVAGEEDGYRLQSGLYSGNAGDNLEYHNGMAFTTIDRDNDLSNTSCASLNGGWWYKNCYKSKFTGYLYGKPNSQSAFGVQWGNTDDIFNVLTYVDMKIRTYLA